ncbi:FecR domain-containing protein [Pseudomonas sp. Marseille-P9899]|uniref:FecR domain-containing protein n=1 Tax=Pseudomonas sp. Marseille-P9899 TaxID=2730401 RepID=UPI00158D453D|nr:FecR domain-containing protein [Pseudomonas sp. Marseille-P9899]
MTETASAAQISPQALEEAAEWLMCMGEGDVSEAEQAAWRVWRSSSPDRERAWQRAELLMGKLGGLPPTLAMSALDRPGNPGRRAVITRLAMFLALAPASWLGFNLSERQGWMADYRAAIGECREIILVDGTQVFLNTDSAIDVRFDPDQRLIRLVRGEILVQTAADSAVPARPLRVATSEGRMQALGTRFSVRERAGRTYLAVLEGAIRVEAGSAAFVTPLVVKAGEKTDFDARATAPVSRVDETVTAWTQGMLLADKMRMDDFAAELARYGRGFVRCDPAIADLLVSGAYPINDRRRTLNMLAATYSISVTEHMSGYWTLLAAR